MMMTSGQAVKYHEAGLCQSNHQLHMSFMKGVGAAILARWYRFGGGLLAGYDRLKKLYACLLATI